MSEAVGALHVLGVDNAMFAVGDFELAIEFYAGRLGLVGGLLLLAGLPLYALSRRLAGPLRSGRPGGTPDISPTSPEGVSR